MTATGGPFILSEAWPIWLLALGLCAAAASWAALYRLAGRLAPAGAAAADVPTPAVRTHRAALAAARAALAFGAVWLAIQILGKAFLLMTTWPAWLMAAFAAGAGEGLIWLYAVERRVVSPRTGRTLIALRLALLGLLLVMVLQPVWASVWTDWKKRSLIILVDVSASMHISDDHMPPHEKLRLAEAFSVAAARRPYEIERTAAELGSARKQMAAEAAWLERLAQGKKASARARLLDRRAELNEKIAGWADHLDRQAADLEAIENDTGVLDEQSRAALLDAKATLNRQVLPRLQDAAGWTSKQRQSSLGTKLDSLREALRRAATNLGKAETALEGIGEEMDLALYNSLSPADRAAIDAVARMTRHELALATLLHRRRSPDDPAKTSDSLLERLAKEYDVSVFTFADSLTEADPDQWRDPVADALASPAPRQPVDGPSADEARPGRTDLGGALTEALSRLGGKDLAGVLILSEGQDNGPEKPEPIAAQLGGRGVALCAAVMGAARPPTDAAIVSIDAPETVYLADRMFIDAELKLDGLAGHEVKVTLYDEAEVVDTKTLRPAGESFRTHIQLAHEPDKVGLHSYRIDVRPAAENVREVFTDNNSYQLALAVVDDKTNILLLDSRPRWEFRYLKNLFSGRDKTVRLQYVLTEPDSYAGQPAVRQAAASVARPDGRIQAGTLPASPDEWMKFDVIIIGDVAAKDLPGESVRMLKRFVADRGGTAIFIAGPRSMPADHAAGPLAELIPLRLSADPASKPASRPDRRGFRIAVTPAGAEHVVLRQDVRPNRSREIWRSLPRLYWHSRFTRAAPASSVLAYALGPEAPKWLAEPAPDQGAENLEQRRREYRRSHALITVAPHGLGKVMVLGFDRSWRLRYRVGDTRHHKLWGQVIRWATAGELPAGTHLVKLGADRTRYPPRSRPKVRAKIVRRDYSPVVTEQVAVKVFSDGKLLARVPMRYVEDSPGIYSATLGELDAGRYRLELDAPAAAELLAADGVKTVSMEIAIDPAAPSEQIELAANYDLLGRLASMSYNGLAVPPHQAQRIPAALPAGTVPKQHRRELSLKQHWPPWVLLGLFCAAAAAEWILRKRAGLA